MGLRIIVLGSGGARRVPAGFPLARAWDQFREFALRAGDAAGRRGLTIALEPINRSETNLLHRVEEAARLCQELSHPAIGVLADLYHMHMEGEPLSALVSAGQRLVHTHVADAGRGIPGERNSADLLGFCTFLNALGYQGGIAVECAFQRFTREGPVALSNLRAAARCQGELRFAP